MFPSAAEPAEVDLGPEALREAIRNIRYFGLANLIRGLSYLPLLAALCLAQAWAAAALIGALVVFHALCVALEAYKSALARRCAPRGVDSPPEPRALPERHWFFGPHRWETTAFYRAIGMEGMRAFAIFVIDTTRLSTKERRQGEKTAYYSDLGRFVADTRVAEAMHLGAAALNLPALVAMIAKGWLVWIVYTILIIIGDLGLAVLQRYHRARAWPLVERRRRRK